MKTEIIETFLSLVRLGIGASKDAKIPKDVDWQAVKMLADRQGLSAIILDALNTDDTRSSSARLLPEGRKNLTDGMPLEFKLEWIGEVLQAYEQQYELYKKAIGSLAGFYNQHGFKMMVLKGYACSLDWPKPEHRPCGDIDIWLFGRQVDADKGLDSWFKVQGSSQRVDTSEHHHTVFYWKDFMVENHYDFINVHHHKSHAEYERVLKELGKDDSYSVEVNGERVYLPSPNLNALFLFKHLLLHFATGEITLRQVLDWAFFVEKHGKEFDWTFVMDVLEKHGVMQMFNVINAICVGDLGFKLDIFPQVQFDPSLKDRVIDDIFNPKFAGEMPKNVIRRIIYKYKRWKANEWKHELCYKESMWSAFWSGVWGHLLKPSSI